jgi:4a-hydroxytetrahydrobiopterin dehydratase
MTLAGRHCVPCEGGVAPLEETRVRDLLGQVSGWEAREGKIRKSYKFASFVAAMSFLNRVAEVAEGEGHHPDFCVHYDRVDMTIWTHAAGGLTENDFILAAKIDELLKDHE